MTQARVDHFRSFARFRTVMPLWISPLGATFEQAVRLVDVGLGGLCFEIAEGMEVGQRLRLELELPGLWDRLTLHGEVAWTGPGSEGMTRMGVRFSRPTGRALRILAENLG
jgi:Tfp pilus assembly protein PilZ